MIYNEHVDAVLIDDDDFMRDEWNQEYDPLADIESLTAMYLDVIFTSPSTMYDKEAKFASTMIENGLLTNNITKLMRPRGLEHFW